MEARRIDAEAEAYGQARELYDLLTCPKDCMLFSEAESAPLHVQTGCLAVSSQRVFDWIDEKLGRTAASSLAGREEQRHRAAPRS